MDGDSEFDSDNDSVVRRTTVDIIDRRRQVSVPQFVYACQLMTKNRDVQFLTAMGRVNVTIETNSVRTGNATPVIRYRIEGEWRRQTTNRRLVILSLRIREQDARTFPIDFQLSLLGAPRPYVVQRRRHIAAMNVELITDGLAYMNEACSLAFCALDAANFSLTPTETITTTAAGHVVIPKCYRYAGLLREVVMARQLTRMDALTRSCATRSMLTDAPLESSSAWIYTNPDAFYEAVEFVQEQLLPCSRRTLSPTEPGAFDAKPLSSDTSSWTSKMAAYAVVDAPKRFDASVQFIIHLASIV